MDTTARTRRALLVLFGLYLFLLIWIVLWKVHVPFIGRDDMRAIKLVPFGSGDGFGGNDPYELVANLLLFVPFGVYLRLLVPRWSWWEALAVIAGTSLVLEAAQFVLAVGSSDVTDLIVNTAGGGAGLALGLLVRRRPWVAAWALGIGTALAVAAIVVILAAIPRMPQAGGGEVVIMNVATARMEP